MTDRPAATNDKPGQLDLISSAAKYYKWTSLFTKMGVL